MEQSESFNQLKLINNENASEEHKPQEFIIDPLMSIHNEIDDLNIEVDNLRREVAKNTQLLSEILDKDTGILKEQKDKRPVGKVFRRREIVTPTQFVIIDSNKIPGDGHKYRAYTVTNVGKNNIYVGFNVAFSPQLDASIEDLVSDEQRFDFLEPGESTNDSFDTEVIASLHIIADPATGLGNSEFKAKLIW